jgi:hypothetical protein
MIRQLPLHSAALPAPTTDVLGEVPAGDKLDRAVARSRIEAALFEATEQVKLGRYHLLEKVGAGGMGVVWGAWDPELDRRVAVKLVPADAGAQRDRILLEGRALAKLSHPNVVAVHDVGTVDDQVYIVMEWVRGKNLREHCKEPRTVREIVALYKAAGEGLAAAHRAGLIHRDFKPDNAVVGDDGRVRVLDFGLAHSATSEDPARVGGTPRYMAPEQRAGATLTPAVDQYALCVSLREALPEVPSWIEAIVTRGTSHDPAARYPAMDELLRALARDPRTVWRRRILVAGAVVVAGTAFAAGTMRGGAAAVEPCTGAPEEIASTWNAGVRGQLASHLRGLGRYGSAEAPRVDRELDGFNGQWIASHRGACIAQHRGELSPGFYERNLGCLARAQVAMQTVIDVLGTSTAASLPDAIVAARSLPHVDRCLTETKTSTVLPPPPEQAATVAALENRIEAARVRGLAIRPDAITIATELAAEAEATRYLPVIARARLTQGLAMIMQGDGTSAVAPLARAVEAALDAGDDAVGIEALAREIYAWVLSDRSKLPAGTTDPASMIPLAQPIARRLGSAGTFQRALLLNNAGTARMASGDPAGARTMFLTAEKSIGNLAPQSYELATIWVNLAMVTPEPAERDRLSARAVRELERILGPDHPIALMVRSKAGSLVEDQRTALPLLREPCARLGALHPHLDSTVSECFYEVGLLAEDLGLATEARAAFAQVRSPTNATAQELAGAFVLLLDGKPADAERVAAPLIDSLAAQAGFYGKLRAVDAAIVVATAHRAAGRTREATATWRRAKAILDELRFLATAPMYRRYVARVGRELR